MSDSRTMLAQLLPLRYTRWHPRSADIAGDDDLLAPDMQHTHFPLYAYYFIHEISTSLIELFFISLYTPFFETSIVATSYLIIKKNFF